VPAPEAIPSGSFSDSASVVRYEHVTKRYPGAGSAAVEDLSLEVPAGEICVIVGPSGCGKTTAMRMANRMVEITEGDILIGDQSVRDRPPAELRRDIGYVIQQIGLFPHRTITENIGTVPRLLGWDADRIAARTDELLDLVGLDRSLGERYPVQLSGGQQQRVGVARALAVDPPVMLMDEPFGAIDPINRERLQNEFLRLQAEIRKTILFVTHDIDEAIKMGDRIAVMQVGGKLAQYATPAELLMNPATEFVEDFVGADRGLKRLSLMRVSDVNLREAPLAFAGQDTAEVRSKLAATPEVPYALLVDSGRRPIGWLSERDLAQATVPERPDTIDTPVLDRDDVLRDALSDLLQGGVQYAPVTDPAGQIAGILSVEIISECLNTEGGPDGRPAPSPVEAKAP
jgi:osmoprotectant transport system ATP-binding protein